MSVCACLFLKGQWAKVRLLFLIDFSEWSAYNILKTFGNSEDISIIFLAELQCDKTTEGFNTLSKYNISFGISWCSLSIWNVTYTNSVSLVSNKNYKYCSPKKNPRVFIIYLWYGF